MHNSARINKILTMGAGARPCTNHRYSYIKKADHDAKGATLLHITMVLNDFIMFHTNDDKSCKSLQQAENQCA